MHSHPVLFGKFLCAALNSIGKNLWADSYLLFLGPRYLKKATFRDQVSQQHLGGKGFLVAKILSEIEADLREIRVNRCLAGLATI